MEDCPHVHLIKVTNEERGGTASTTYECEECKKLFKRIDVPPIAVSYDPPPEA